MEVQIEVHISQSLIHFTILEDVTKVQTLSKQEEVFITIQIFSFPGTSVLFLYRNVKETVISFQRVMAAFTTLARFFTNDQVTNLPHNYQKRDENRFSSCRR